MSYLLLESGDQIVLEAGDGFLLLDEVTANVAGSVKGGTSAVGTVRGGVSVG